MSVPTCPYCQRLLSDPRGCEPGDGSEREPVLYGQEQDPLSSDPTCRDCGTPRGATHHAGCSCTECPRCGLQWHGVEGDCEANRALVTGGSHAPRG